MATISITIGAVLSIILGLLILVFPKILRFALGLYLIVIGILGLINM